MIIVISYLPFKYMSISNNIIGYLRNKNVEVSETNELVTKGIIKTVSFTSVGGGSGSSMVINYISQYLSREEGKQVCVLDLNFLSPDLLYQYNVDVTEENTLLNFIKGRRSLQDCYIQDRENSKIHLVTASPKDNPMLWMSTSEDGGESKLNELMEELTVFDYVLVNLPNERTNLPFTVGVQRIDKGYLVLDERLNSINKVKLLLDFIHVYHRRSGSFGNIILNKRTEKTYNYELLEEAKSELVCEIPFEDEIVEYMNVKKDLYKQPLTKEFQASMYELMQDMNK